MGLNPFGEESDSTHAWKERFKQQQFQTQTLRSQLSETKTQLEELQIKYEEVSRQLHEREEELTQAKQDLRAMREISDDKNEKLMDLTKRMDQDRISKLEKDNQKLRDQLEKLQGVINRGGYHSSQGSTQDPSSITVALIPMMLYEYDPTSSKYQDAFINLVETVIEEGNVLAKTIAILIKYGGKGPIDKLREKVNSPEFQVAIDTLIDGGVLKTSDNTVMIDTSEQSVTIEPTELSTSELFDNLLYNVENDPVPTLKSTLETFRDRLQEREVPLTTIYFEIRKTIERIEKNRLTRPDIKKQVKEWKSKYEALS